MQRLLRRHADPEPVWHGGQRALGHFEQQLAAVLLHNKLVKLHGVLRGIAPPGVMAENRPVWGVTMLSRKLDGEVIRARGRNNQ